ncbi:MAG: cytochrome o ubiquinol oxidase subunit III [Chlamydiota bacterium]
MTDHHTQNLSKTLLGFWIYLMTDCILFATLFATYAVLYTKTFGGPSGADIFSLPFVLAETLILLTSSFTSGLALIGGENTPKKTTLFWCAITFLLGAAFLTLEISEFHHLVKEGFSWERSAFLSAFFTLVATHGLHITTGLIWMIILLVPVCKEGLTPTSFRRLTCLKLFWHFLDVVWIFIFTLVYLMGAK